MGLILTTHQLEVLRVLDRTERTLCVTEIADRADLNRHRVGDILHDFWRCGWAERRWGDGRNESRRCYPITADGRRALRDADQAYPDEGVTETPPPEWIIDCADPDGEHRQVRVVALPDSVCVVPPLDAPAFKLTGAQVAEYRAALAAAARETGREMAQGARDA